jgi:hypothetical protein
MVDANKLAGLVGTLREVDPRYLKPEPGPLKIRWFRGMGIELHLWLEPDGRIDHLHFIVGPRALIWSQRRGFLMGEAEQDQRGPGTTGMMPAAEIIVATSEVDGMREALSVVAERGPMDEALKARLQGLLAMLPPGHGR